MSVRLEKTLNFKLALIFKWVDINRRNEPAPSPPPSFTLPSLLTGAQISAKKQNVCPNTSFYYPK